MKMFLKRMVMTGDISHNDLPKNSKPGLGEAVRNLAALRG
jgi:phosphate starvation-inducible protein PhoH